MPGENRKARQVIAVFGIRKNALWGFINARGEMVVEPQFESVLKWSEGVAAFRAGGEYGFVNTEGKIVCQPVFEKADLFSEGLCHVRRDGENGYIDSSFEVRFTHPYQRAAQFHEGVARAVRPGAVDYLDSSGRVVLRNNLLESDCSEGLIAFREDGTRKVGYRTSDGRWCITSTFTSVGDFSEELAAVRIKRGGKQVEGFINREGEFVFTHHFTTSNARFSEGLALVFRRERSRELAGYLGKNGQVQIPFEFDWADHFRKVWPGSRQKAASDLSTRREESLSRRSSILSSRSKMASPGLWQGTSSDTLTDQATSHFWAKANDITLKTWWEKSILS